MLTLYTAKRSNVLCIHKKITAFANVLLLYVRHTLDVRSRQVLHTLRYVSTNVCGHMRNSASVLVYAEYVRDKF